MLFDLTRGELILVGIISALIYGAGLIPRLITYLSGARDASA